MTYIIEMASGMECPGDNLYSPSTGSTCGAPPAVDCGCATALQLVPAETAPAPQSAFPAAAFLDAMIAKLED